VRIRGATDAARIFRGDLEHAGSGGSNRCSRCRLWRGMDSTRALVHQGDVGWPLQIPRRCV